MLVVTIGLVVINCNEKRNKNKKEKCNFIIIVVIFVIITDNLENEPESLISFSTKVDLK